VQHADDDRRRGRGGSGKKGKKGKKEKKKKEKKEKKEKKDKPADDTVGKKFSNPMLESMDEEESDRLDNIALLQASSPESGATSP